MPVEQNLVDAGQWSLIYGGAGYGQRLTITNRVVKKLSFPLQKIGSPGSGNITFQIRKVSDGSTIISKVWGDAQSIPVTETWEEVTFDTPTLINEEVRLTVINSGSGSAGNGIGVFWSGANVCSGNLFTRSSGGTYSDDGSLRDAPFTYTYDLPPVTAGKGGVPAKLVAAGAI
jgi:hypothetical protein